MVERIAAAAARRIALGAQGLAAAPAVAPTTAAGTTRRVLGALDRLRILQIDSVSVFERSHYLPLLARLGPYPKALLDRLTMAEGAPFTEYWAHEAAFLRTADLALFGWRRDGFAERAARPGAWAAEHGHVLDRLRRTLADTGPTTASDLDPSRGGRRGPWWDWSEAKRGLEHLFAVGEAVAAGRQGFERRYALPTGAAAEALHSPAPDVDAIRELLRRAAVAHGIGTTQDLADYHRIRGPRVRTALAELADAGDIERVEVPGWSDAAGRPLATWLHRDARRPRTASGAALLSPFDPVVWFRPRAERLFGFRYRIEIYTPAARRVHGYYVLPVLVDDVLAARVDLKRDRAGGRLLVQSAWSEPDAPDGTPERLATLLRTAAAWQGLDDVEVVPRGDLAPALTAALRR